MKKIEDIYYSYEDLFTLLGYSIKSNDDETFVVDNEGNMIPLYNNGTNYRTSDGSFSFKFVKNDRTEGISLTKEERTFDGTNVSKTIESNNSYGVSNYIFRIKSTDSEYGEVSLQLSDYSIGYYIRRKKDDQEVFRFIDFEDQSYVGVRPYTIKRFSSLERFGKKSNYINLTQTPNEDGELVVVAYSGMLHDYLSRDFIKKGEYDSLMEQLLSHKRSRDLLTYVTSELNGNIPGLNLFLNSNNFFYRTLNRMDNPTDSSFNRLVNDSYKKIRLDEVNTESENKNKEKKF